LKPQNDKWEKFKARHGNKISKKNEAKRMEKFFERLAKIEAHNDEYAKGESKYFTDVNEMTDLDEAELKQKTGFIPPEASRVKRSLTAERFAFGPNRPIFRMYQADAGVVLPQSINWAATGWADPVWDQKDCGSCWAFSTGSVISAQLFIKKNVSALISQQDFVDCSRYLSTNGCSGGSQANAMEYAILNGTSVSNIYKYINAEQACQEAVRTTSPLYKISGFVQLQSSHDTLKQALAEIGPITVSIDVEEGFFAYKGGIYDGKKNGVLECSEAGINHAVTVVGYGTDAASKTDFWLIKNTWGTTWGEGGYVRLLRSNDNLCGIYKYMYAPIIL